MSAKLTSGIVGILHSPSGTMCLIMFITASVALFTRHLDSTAYGVMCGVIGGLFGVSHHYLQGKLLDNSGKQPQS
jgi:hypothetical protein